jgi:hypothetical protein
LFIGINLIIKKVKKWGFSLVELMVALGLSSVMIMVVVNLIGTSGKTTADMASTFQVAEWSNTINHILSTRKYCRPTFQSKLYNAVAGEEVDALYLGPKIRSSVHKDRLENNTKIVSLTLRSPVLLDPSTYRIELEAIFDQSGKIITRRFPFIAKVVFGTTEISDCFGKRDEELIMGEVCGTLGGVNNPGFKGCDFFPGTEPNKKLIEQERRFVHQASQLSKIAVEFHATLCEMEEQICINEAPTLSPFGINCDMNGGPCGLLTCSGGGTHTVTECVALNPPFTFAYDSPHGSVCVVPGSTCPAGWNACLNYSATSATPCKLGCGSGTPASHVYGAPDFLKNIPREGPPKTTHRDYADIAACGDDGKGNAVSCCHADPAMPKTACLATVTHVGCK